MGIQQYLFTVQGLHARKVQARRHGPIARPRNGGKPPALALLKPVKPSSKRADFLRWFLTASEGRSVGATVAKFGISRANVFTYWTTIHREHGVGYALVDNTITVLLPVGSSPTGIFNGGTDGT